jgi:sugar lactone lactonase YvrE
VETEQADPTIPSHREIESIGAGFENLTTFCMDAYEDLLACDAKAKQIRKLTPAGKTLATWNLEFAPWAIHTCPDGTIYTAGPGIVAKLDKTGKVLKTATLDDNNSSKRKAKPSGITANEKDVFVCVGSGWSLRSRSSIVRFDHDLGQPKTIAKDLRGCCQRLDIVAKDDVLYVAENTRYRVLRCDRQGEILSKWGNRDRKNIEGFGSCCNPMNLCFGPEGELYTAESGLGRIKRYTPDGEFLGLIGHVGVERFKRAGRLAASCSNITIAVNEDASRIYVLDFKKNMIRVLAQTDAGFARKSDTQHAIRPRQ